MTIQGSILISTLSGGRPAREKQWTQSLAVGSRRFVDSMKYMLGLKAKYRSVEKVGPVYRLHEDPMEPYSAGFDTEIEGLSIENGYDLKTSGFEGRSQHLIPEK